MGLFRKKTDDPEQLDALRSEIVSLRERLDAADRQKAELLDKVESVDQVSAALYQRFSSRGESDFADRILSAMRSEFGGHKEKTEKSG